MKICASLSYQCGLEICPTEIFKQLFLIKINFYLPRSLVISHSLHSLYKHLHLQKDPSSKRPEEIANFLADSASSQHLQ